MKLSIITPCYNAEKFIEQTILSVQQQKGVNIEHIIVDGGSTDGTLSILKKYPHLKWISEPDKGQSDAINKGFQMATGEIFAWQNADDWYLPDTLVHVMNHFQNHPKADFVYGYYKIADGNGRILIDAKPPDWSDWKFKHGRFCPPQPSTFWRRTAWEACGPLRLELHFAMDLDFYCRCVAAGKVFQQICMYIGVFRSHDASKTQNASNLAKHRKEIYKVLKDQFSLSPLDMAIVKFYQHRGHIAGLVRRLSGKCRLNSQI
jgi:glycosyltransferase involved in cell wall biosynthesis